MKMDRKKALRILCAEPHTDIRGLKKRYRDLMRKTHPDAVAEHDYPYEVHEINEAYNYLLAHLFDDDETSEGAKEPQIRWNAPINPNAFCNRPIYQYVEDANGNIIGNITVDTGKYMWIEDEDHPLFVKSLYDTARSVIADDDEKKGTSRTNDIELLKQVMYLLSSQFFGADAAFELMTKCDDGSHYAKAMLEMNAGADVPNAGDVLIPSKVADHRLYVADKENRELGYLSFKDDRLLFGLVPLFERRALGIKMICKSKGRPKKSVDVDLWLRPVEEDATSAIESINLRIKQILNGESQI
jgi:hypothetical protein